MPPVAAAMAMAATAAAALLHSASAVTVTVGADTYRCDWDRTNGHAIRKCPDGSTVETFKVAVGGKSWDEVCTQACIAWTVDRTQPKDCVGISLVSKKLCMLALCPASSPTAGEVGLVKLPKRKDFTPAAGVFPSGCFVKQPKPSKAPIAQCDDARLSNLNSREFDSSMFEEVFPAQSLCELVELKGPGGIVMSTTLANFDCDFKSCMRYCQYDSGCRYAFYSDVERKCIKSAKLQLTDDPNRFKEYFAQNWRAFRRVDGDNVIPYYSGACNQNPADKCNKLRECRWNRGKKGYNDEDFGGAAGGHCGRVRCSAAPTMPPRRKKSKKG